MRTRALAASMLGAFCAWTVGPAQAVVVDQGAVALTMIGVFGGFASLLFLILVALVAVVSRPPHRGHRLRFALIGFAAATVVAAIVLVVIRTAHDFALMEAAVLGCAAFLIAIALAIVVHAQIRSRRAGG